INDSKLRCLLFIVNDVSFDKEKQTDAELLNQKESKMAWEDRIVVDPKVLVGKPVIRGTRIAVEFLIELLANGWTHEQILKNYPHLAEDDIQAALHYAAETVKREHVYPLPV
ncbi:MAG TPA: DUF433 domain-containing protein, partial [Planctomycetaceae bacterium]